VLQQIDIRLVHELVLLNSEAAHRRPRLSKSIRERLTRSEDDLELDEPA